MWDTCTAISGRQFVWFLMSCSMNLLWMCIFPTLRQTSLWFIAVLKFPSYSLFGFLSLKPFEVNDLLQGLNFSKVLNSLVALNKATEGKITVCVWESSIYSISANIWTFLEHLPVWPPHEFKMYSVASCICRFECFWGHRMCGTLLNLKDQVLWLSEHSESLLETAAASVPQPGE